jgi:hypothetical protein
VSFICKPLRKKLLEAYRPLGKRSVFKGFIISRTQGDRLHSQCLEQSIMTSFGGDADEFPVI